MGNEASGNGRGTKVSHEKWKFVERRNADEFLFHESVDPSRIVDPPEEERAHRRRAVELRGARVFVRSTRAVSTPVVNEERRWNGKKRKASQ